MRKFVQEHPDYKQDSVVTPGIAYDLVKECRDISEGLKACPELHGDHVIDKLPEVGQLYNKPLDTAKLKKCMTHGGGQVNDLISRYAERADHANKKRRLNKEILTKELELEKLKSELSELGDAVMSTPHLTGRPLS